MISATNIYYQAGGKKILQDVSCQLEAGKLTVVLGSNGAGKSSLLKILAGALKPAKGNLAFKGREYGKISPAAFAKERAVLTQHFGVNMPFKCHEIVLMGRYPHFASQPTEKDHHIVHEAMEEMHVHVFEDRYFHTLSGGEQQRVQMARVLCQLWPENDQDNKKFMLLDEPVSSMDCLYQQVCLQSAKKMAEKGFAVLVVLHDLNLAAQYADEVILMRKGRVIASGPGRSVLQASSIKEAYDYEVEVVYHDDFYFPLIIPAVHKKQAFIIQTKSA